MSEKIIWWEKTVEYAFILELAKNQGSLFATPLSGKHEAASDLILATESTFILIEFKRSAAELDGDKIKFTNYDSSSNELKSRDSCHFFVYGEPNSNDTNKTTLCLKAKTYFSRKDQNAITNLPKSGLKKPSFDIYLKELLSHKKVDGRSSSGNVSLNDFALVAGINKSGEIESCISLTKYAEDFLRTEPSPPTYNLSTPNPRGGRKG